MKDVIGILKRGQPLDEAGLNYTDGRAVIADLVLGQTDQNGALRVGGTEFGLVGSTTEFKGVSWKNLHFTRCDFTDCRFTNVEIHNCVFEKCKLVSSFFWKSSVQDTLFLSCNMRHCALGGFNSLALLKKPNHFDRCRFERCDLRSSPHSCEQYRFCEFDHCRLKNVLFFGAVFEDCVFRGLLDGVEFRDRLEHGVPPNRLLRCDFREAELRECQFIKLGLDSKMFPSSEGFIWLPKGPDDLRRLKATFDLDNFYIEHSISTLGSPSYLTRSTLHEIGLTSAQIQWLTELSDQNEL